MGGGKGSSVPQCGRLGKKQIHDARVQGQCSAAVPSIQSTAQ